jgi:hypothetical protein
LPFAKQTSDVGAKTMDPGRPRRDSGNDFFGLFRTFIIAAFFIGLGYFASQYDKKLDPFERKSLYTIEETEIDGTLLVTAHRAFPFTHNPGAQKSACEHNDFSSSLNASIAEIAKVRRVLGTTPVFELAQCVRQHVCEDDSVVRFANIILSEIVEAAQAEKVEFTPPSRPAECEGKGAGSRVMVPHALTFSRSMKVLTAPLDQ